VQSHTQINASPRRDQLPSDGIHLSLRGKRVFGEELVGLIDRALN